MPANKLAEIRNYLQLTDRIATAGQPTRQELVVVAEAGYETVINLHTSSDLPDEGDLVRALGLGYVHIDVPWEHPERSHLERFFEAMERRQDQRLFVHCAANKRVSAFMALYRIHKLGWAVEDALGYVDVPSFPSVWQAFIETMLTASFGA